MSRLSQKQIVEQIKMLKLVKPRKEWALLVKSEILSGQKIENKTTAIQAKSVGFMNIFSYALLQRKLAYSFAVILFLIVGVFGFARYTVPGDLLFPIRKLSEQSQAALSGQTVIKQDVATLSNRISDLASISKQGKKDNVPSTINEISQNASELAKTLKENPVQDLATIKAIANSLKTLADIPGTDLTVSVEVQGLYQTIVSNQIEDLQKTTLTDDQKVTLLKAQDLYGQGKYTDALELILLIGK